jgi:DNA-binding CsgD family transcriptional regulator
LIAAIHTVTEGGSVGDPTIVDALVAARVQANESLLSDLTPRERGILSEMAKGKNNAAIAATLGITEHSLEKYIHSIFVKLGLAWEPDTHISELRPWWCICPGAEPPDDEAVWLRIARQRLTIHLAGRQPTPPPLTRRRRRYSAAVPPACTNDQPPHQRPALARLDGALLLVAASHRIL